MASFHLVVTIAVLLTVLGLVMVLSASSVESYADGGSAYSMFTQQAMYAALGTALFYLALRLPVRLLRAAAFPLFAGSVTLLVLVLIPGIGVEAQGARRWFMLGPVSIQPSEIVKVALALWGAHLLAVRRVDRAGWRQLVVPLVPAAVFVCVLVVLQPNLSTAIAIGIILAALMWFGGLPARMFLSVVAAGATGAVLLALSAGYRSDRMKAFFNPGHDPQGIGYQARQAQFSLADGHWFGVGLGQSRAKWSYLPNSHNDFIFAIIGEELGFLGGLALIALFALFAYIGLRIAARNVDPFLQLLAATGTVWITAQAFINIGYVVGLLPVTGQQLPLVSYGGSSLAITLFMFGLIASAARHEPESIAALAAGQDGRFSKLLRLPKPQPYTSPRRPSATRRPAVRRSPAPAGGLRSAAPRAGNGRSRGPAARPAGYRERGSVR
nr:putative lipid II flippase FtsW [Skermania piniformis]